MLNEKMIEKIDREIVTTMPSSVNKIENSNYILSMLLKDIRDGKVTDILDVAEWCFDKINTARNINYLLTHQTK